jgi:hypothetical protein
MRRHMTLRRFQTWSRSTNLVDDLAEDEGEALRYAGYRRSNELLELHRAKVERPAQARLQRCSSAKRPGYTTELTYSRSGWRVRCQVRSRSGNDLPDTKSPDSTTSMIRAHPARRTGTAKAITLPRQGRFPQDWPPAGGFCLSRMLA